MQHGPACHKLNKTLFKFLSKADYGLHWVCGSCENDREEDIKLAVYKTVQKKIEQDEEENQEAQKGEFQIELKRLRELLKGKLMK